MCSRPGHTAHEMDHLQVDETRESETVSSASGSSVPVGWLPDCSASSGITLLQLCATQPVFSACLDVAPSRFV